MAEARKKKQVGVATKESQGVEGEGTMPLHKQEPVSESRREPQEPKKAKPRVEKAESHKAGPRNDAVVKYLSEVEGNDKLLTAVRKHDAFKHINKEAFDNAAKKKDKIGEGLFRMRMGNMLRGAVSRSKKAK